MTNTENSRHFFTRAASATLAIAILILGLGGCAAPREAIGVVSAKPPSVAYRLLQKEASAMPRLKAFLREKGYPNVVHHVTDGNQAAFLLFYTKRGVGYAVLVQDIRTRQMVQIRGPEPIGPQGLRMLKALEKMSSAAAELRSAAQSAAAEE